MIRWFRVGKLSTSSFGSLLLSCLGRVWDAEREREREREREMWKGEYYSKDGRLTLIKSTLYDIFD